MTLEQFCQLAQIGTFIATASIAVIAWWELKQIRVQSRTTFEDSLTDEYRKIMKNIPTDIWLGSELKTIKEEQQQGCRDAIFRYIDLSNEQAFLQDQGRVRPETWRIWREGIIYNMALPAFVEVWKEVAMKSPESFEFLRKLIP
jgi:hypothetical protein